MPDIDRHAASCDDRVSWYQLTAYGMGGVIPIALFNIAGQLMGLLGNISLGLSALWLGVIMVLPRLWDAVSDPLIGHLSDNTRSRWGRRRPFILVGGIAVAISFVAMWWVPRGEWIQSVLGSGALYNWFQLGYILLGLLVFFTACTVFEIPHGALGMEMSTDYHERTRLFSAKSFLGNTFAMGTPWLIYFAGWEFFRGHEGDLADGMRYVSLFIAAALIPLSFWWFRTLSEPGFTQVKDQQKTAFWADMRQAAGNKTFLQLVVIIFTLAMGFNFVALFNYYITIFYLFAGDEVAAGALLGINGTAWAITGLVAVFPLNWISRRIGKNKTLLLSILLMCAAQLSKIICYNPEHPYLVIIPTVLLSAGMLMFFTLGASMVGDICDEDELRRDARSEGTYYSVYWWFIKLGTAFASVVTGILLVYTQFDEQQNVLVNELNGDVAAVCKFFDAKGDKEEDAAGEISLQEALSQLALKTNKLQGHLAEQSSRRGKDLPHVGKLLVDVTALATLTEGLQQELSAENPRPAVSDSVVRLTELTGRLKRQSPVTLFRLRAVEIGLPLVLSLLSIYLTLRYPLTEQRCYEIKQALEERRAAS